MCGRFIMIPKDELSRIIADVIADNHAFVWDRTKPDTDMLALLANEKYAPIVVFPQQYAGSAT